VDAGRSFSLLNSPRGGEGSKLEPRSSIPALVELRFRLALAEQRPGGGASCNFARVRDEDEKEAIKWPRSARGRIENRALPRGGYIKANGPSFA